MNTQSNDQTILDLIATLWRQANAVNANNQQLREELAKAQNELLAKTAQLEAALAGTK